MSQDIPSPDDLVWLGNVEVFVDSVSKSDDLPFIFEKDFNGVRIRKTNAIAEQCYFVLSNQIRSRVDISRFFGERHKEPSESVKCFCEVLHQMQLNNFMFTGNPLMKLNHDGFLEGELVNSVVIRLRESTRRKSFKSKRDQRKKQINTTLSKSNRYLERLHENTPNLIAQHFIFCYQQDHIQSEITLQASANHFNAFLETFKEDHQSSPILGYWWNREYLSEEGYRYYLILFFDPAKSYFDHQQAINTFSEHWFLATDKQGKSYLAPDMLPAISLPPKDKLLLLTQFIMKSETLLRLNPNHKIDHCGMGDIPPKKQ